MALNIPKQYTLTMKIKEWFKVLLFEPWKTFVLSFLFGLASNNSSFLFKFFNLPEISKESDNLTYFQILLGEGISILVIIIHLLSIFFSIIFTVSLFYFFYRLLFKYNISKKVKK